ncbi:MAG TPA: hypothetical protein PLA96_14125 [Candidatus Brocadia sapporoensis]|nr:hypothetical protein [Candidatus Brocadia sapporoensis]
MKDRKNEKEEIRAMLTGMINKLENKGNYSAKRMVRENIFSE